MLLSIRAGSVCYMRIGFAQACLERHGCGWLADSIATALSAVCPGDDIILYHQFCGWINWDTYNGTVVQRTNVSSLLLGSSWVTSKVAWRMIAAGRADLPGNPEIVHSHRLEAPVVGDARLVYTVYDLSFWTHSEFTTEVNRITCQGGLLDAIHSAAGLVFISENSRRDFLQLFPGLAERRGLVMKGIWRHPGFPASVRGGRPLRADSLFRNNRANGTKMLLVARNDQETQLGSEHDDA